MGFRARPSSTKDYQPAFINKFCTVCQHVLHSMSTSSAQYFNDITLRTATLLRLSFKQAIPNLSNGSAVHVVQCFQVHFCNQPSLALWKTQRAQKHPVSSQNGHPRTIMALAGCGHWNCGTFPAHQGTSGACSLCRRQRHQGEWFQPFATDSVHVLPCLWFQPSFRDEGNAQSQRHCTPKGENLRPLHPSIWGFTPQQVNMSSPWEESADL